MKPIPLSVIRELAEVYAAIPPVACKGKCQACCCPIGDFVTQLERARIKAKCGVEPNGAEARANREPCNLLSADGRCTVHAVRPTICRVYGAETGLPCPHGCNTEPLMPVGSCMEYVRAVEAISNRYQKSST